MLIILIENTQLHLPTFVYSEDPICRLWRSALRRISEKQGYDVVIIEH